MSKWLIIAMVSQSLTLPHRYEPRDYQLPFLRAMDSGYKRAVCVWHRRAGKDKTFLNFMIKRMVERVGQYYYYFPTMAQGRKALWDGIDRDGFPFLSHFPKELIQGKPNQVEMKIKFKNGSLFHLAGTDKLEVVGPNPVGCVFSEYSLQHPKGWSFVRPILAENNGWAAFNFTPRGKNHGHDIHRMAQGNPDWFHQVLTVDDTHAITPEALEAERRSGMSETLFQQEFYCSFERGAEGTYYAEVLNWMYQQGRITKVEHHGGLPVYTVSDPGYHWAVLFFQKRGPDWAIIRAYEEMGLGVEKHAELIREIGKEHGYRYGGHYAPVDTENNNAYRAVAGMSLLEHARENLWDITILEPEYRVSEGIERTQHFLHSCWIDKENCADLVSALESYCRTRNERMSTEDLPLFIERPADNWAVHLADVTRYTSKAVEKLPTADDERQLSEIRKLNALYKMPSG